MSSPTRSQRPSADDKDALLRQYHRVLERYVFYDAESYDFVLQRMPDCRADIENKTTCRHPFCPKHDRASQPGTYRVSIEKIKNSEPENQFSREIPLEPAHKWSGSLKYGPFSKDLRGIGKKVVSWWCLECIEDLWLGGEGFIKEPWIPRPRVGPQLWELFCLNVMTTEVRDAGPKNHLYHLSSPQIYAFEKWMAVSKHKASMEGGTYYGPEVVYGCEFDALDENEELLNLESIDEITGRGIVVTAMDVKNLRLSEALKRVDEKLQRGRRLWTEQIRSGLISEGPPNTDLSQGGETTLVIDFDATASVSRTAAPISIRKQASRFTERLATRGSTQAFEPSVDGKSDHDDETPAKRARKLRPKPFDQEFHGPTKLKMTFEAASEFDTTPIQSNRPSKLRRRLLTRDVTAAKLSGAEIEDSDCEVAVKKTEAEAEGQCTTL